MKLLLEDVSRRDLVPHIGRSLQLLHPSVFFDLPAARALQARAIGSPRASRCWTMEVDENGEHPLLVRRQLVFHRTFSRRFRNRNHPDGKPPSKAETLVKPTSSRRSAARALTSSACQVQ